MSLTALQEMLDLREAEKGIVASFKSGYDDAKRRHGAADREARAGQRAGRVVGGEGEEEPTDPAAPKPEEAKKPAKVNTQEIADDLTALLDDFFLKFPNLGDTDTISFKTTESRSALLALANTIKELRLKFNDSLAKQRLVMPKQISTFNRQARAMMGAQAPSPPPSLVKFVKNEARFFTGLFKITNKAELDQSHFKSILSLKIKQTAADRVPDAAQALNLLFGYMYAELVKAHARVATDAAEEEKKQRLAARQQPPAPPEEPATP